MKLRVIYFDDTPTKLIDVKKGVDVIGSTVLIDDVEFASVKEGEDPLTGSDTGKACMVTILPD